MKIKLTTWIDINRHIISLNIIANIQLKVNLQNNAQMNDPEVILYHLIP